jgi:hypothetical protein
MPGLLCRAGKRDERLEVAVATDKGEEDAQGGEGFGNQTMHSLCVT